MAKKKRKRDPQTLADALLDAIEHSPKSRYQLARETGIDAGTLSRFVNGSRTELRLSTIDKLMPALGLTWKRIEND